MAKKADKMKALMMQMESSSKDKKMDKGKKEMAVESKEYGKKKVVKKKVVAKKTMKKC